MRKYIGKKTDGDGGRIDIIVTDGNGNAVIIENKIYAADQDKQMVRYHNYAKHNFNAHNLFYLSLYGEVHDGEKTLYDKKLDIRLEKVKTSSLYPMRTTYSNGLTTAWKRP